MSECRGDTILVKKFMAEPYNMHHDIHPHASMSDSTVTIGFVIQLMGSFDNWTAGFELSPEDYTFSGDQTVSAQIRDLISGDFVAVLASHTLKNQSTGGAH